jgi:hypothetical protein
LRADQLIREAAHGAIAGRDGDVIIRREFALGQPAPEQGCAVTQESGAGRAQPNEHRQRARRAGDETENAIAPGHAGGLGLARDFQRVGGQQGQKGIFGIGAGALGEGEQALFERGEFALGFARGVAPVEAEQGDHQPDAQREGQRHEEQHAGGGHAGIGEGESVGQQDRQHREDQRRGRGDGRAFGEGQEAQAPLDAAEIIGQSG